VVIGLTGKYCAGKNAVADILSDLGWQIIDEDRIGHEALSARSDALVAEFSQAILGDDGEVSRRKLGSVVFSSPESLARLEAIVHPWMVEETKRRIDDAGAPKVVINAAILFKMKLHELCDSVLIVRAPTIRRIARCMKRDGLSLRQIIGRLRAQRGLNRAPKDVDTVTVWNSGSLPRLRRRVEQVLE